jgi:formamidopyrimidine-DNA glycosylase
VPELPEVETVVRDVRPHLVGRRIKSVVPSELPLRRRWAAEWASHLVGRRVEAVERRGKWIIIRLTRDTFLIVHLGMTGQLRVMSATEPVAPHTHLVFGLSPGKQELRFRDVRRFGSATLLTGTDALEQFFARAGLGPEPFDMPAAHWWKRLTATKRCLKAILLDQRVVAGVGNIYADESLFQARLHPGRLGAEISKPQADRLRRAIGTVLNRAIDLRGSSIRDYVGGSGQKGNFQERFRVYQRAGQPCPRCGTPIARIRLAGRSTHFCPQCQPPPTDQAAAHATSLRAE